MSSELSLAASTDRQRRQQAGRNPVKQNRPFRQHVRPHANYLAARALADGVAG